MKLALAQMRVDPGQLEANLDRAEERIAQAAEWKADLILLPECLDLGWTDESALHKAAPIPDGETCRRLIQAAVQNRIHVCAGLTELAGDRRYNAAILISPEGRVLLHHRKIHELDIAKSLYATGDRLSVVDTELGRLGVMICADGFAPGQSVARTLALMGARVIISPCAWAVPADFDQATQPYGKEWIENYGLVCRDHAIHIAGCSNVGFIGSGPWQGRMCIGNSLVMGPQGREIMRLPYGMHSDSLILCKLKS
jgi:predicted amidohydrolase